MLGSLCACYRCELPGPLMFLIFVNPIDILRSADNNQLTTLPPKGFEHLGALTEL